MKKLIYGLAAVCVGLSGCANLMYPASSEPVVDGNAVAIENLRVDIAQLKERVAAMEKSQERLFGECDALKVSSEKQDKDLWNSVSALESSVKTRLSAIEGMRQEIVDSLSKKIVEVMKPRQSSAPVRAERGREHEVQPGETLSAIAAAYKVSLRSVIEANNLKSADSIRVGQRLFIPVQE